MRATFTDGCGKLTEPTVVKEARVFAIVLFVLSSAVPSLATVSPAPLNAQFESQTLTLTGTNLNALTALTVTAPSGSATLVVGTALQSITATSFQVSVVLSAGGVYSFQVANGSGEQSNVLTAVVRTRVPRFVPEGIHLTEVSAGLPGQSIADSASLQLLDGRWRTLFTGATKIHSAISLDGLAMTIEPGIRVDPSGPGGLGPLALAAAIKLFRLPDNKIRAYFFSINGMYSALSSDDGLTFSIEPGVRLPAAAIGDTYLSGGSIVEVSSGHWRMYFGGLARTVLSASSTDLLTWTVDAGVRIGPGTTLPRPSDHPCAIKNPDGSVSVFYFHGPGATGAPGGIYLATSADGLTFTSETFAGIELGNDPDVVVADGAVRMYYNWGTDHDGTISSAKLSGSLALAPAFTNDPVVPGASPVRAAHIVELRQAVDTLRAQYGLPVMVWIDGPLAAGSSPIKAAHVIELRTALGAVYTVLGRAAPSYTSLSPGSPITAAGLAELRQAVRAIW